MAVISYLNQFPVEKLSLSVSESIPIAIPLSLLVLGLTEFLFQITVNLVARTYKNFSKRYHFFIDYEPGHSYSYTNKVGNRKQDVVHLSERGACLNEREIDDGGLRREEVEMVMARLGIFCQPSEDSKFQQRFSSDEFLSIFDENEPSLDEVKGAFNVFDENRDGFIDARELQRVLTTLGLKEGSETHNCKQMINLFDQNGDGRIDFREFVILMEKSFC